MILTRTQEKHKRKEAMQAAIKEDIQMLMVLEAGVLEDLISRALHLRGVHTAGILGIIGRLMGTHILDGNFTGRD